MSKFNMLEVSENRLNGPLPEDMCRGGNLQYFLALDNSFTGELPLSYGACKSLVRFRVNNNNLSSRVPSGIWGLPNVNIVDLSFNNFMGEISAEIKNAKNLSQLAIHNNQFSGNLAPEIGMAVQLVRIEANNNQFTGPLQRYAFYTIADCCVVNVVRDGMNLTPYEYVGCRHGSSKVDEALGLSSGTPKKGMLVVSEFIGCFPSLSGAIRVNPWNIEAVADAMNVSLTIPKAEQQLWHEKHYKYVSTHGVNYWADNFEQDLERVCRDHFKRRCWGIGFGLSFRVVALSPSFRKLATEHIVSAYKRTYSRAILLDYDGTMMPQTSINKTPSPQVISVVNSLCNDPKNVVFIVSGRGRKSLSEWFSPCHKLGIAAEHGYFMRWNQDSEWDTTLPTADFDWKKTAEPVMKLYTETTDGSTIEAKETALVWHHQDADPDFGSCQSKELLDHLESVLANEPVEVKSGQHIVEVKPQGVSKGLVAQQLLSTMVERGKPPDFVLCIGDDRSDEDMFASIAMAQPSMASIVEVFACTVYQKPSKAKYYLDDTVEVMRMLQGLATASDVATKSLSTQVAFESQH